MPDSNTTRLVFNGINAATGDYLLPPLGVDVISKIARNEPLDERHLQELRYRYQRSSKVSLGPMAGVDPNKLDESGWAVIFAHNTPPPVRDALKQLLEHRKTQAGEYYREYAGPNGYRPNESKLDFLARHGAGPGPADPKKVPYYWRIPKCRYAAVRLECFFVDGCVDISSPSSSAFNSARHAGGSQRHSVFRSLAIASRV